MDYSKNSTLYQLYIYEHILNQLDAIFLVIIAVNALFSHQLSVAPFAKEEICPPHAGMNTKEKTSWMPIEHTTTEYLPGNLQHKYSVLPFIRAIRCFVCIHTRKSASTGVTMPTTRLP